MSGTEEKLVTLLVRAGVIDNMQVASARAHQRKFGGKLHEIMASLGLAAEARVADAIARALSVPRVDPRTVPLDPAAIKRLDVFFCEDNVVYPCALRDDNKTLWVAVSDPLDLDLFDLIRVRAKVMRVQPGVAGRGEILEAVGNCYRRRSATQAAAPPSSIDIGYHDDGASPRPPTASSATAAQTADRPSARRDVSMEMDSGFEPGDVFSDIHEPDTDSSTIEDLLFLLKLDHDRSSKELKSIIELCIRKGLFSVDDYRKKLG